MMKHYYDDESDLMKEIKAYLAKGYHGYVQFSGDPIDEKCIFDASNQTFPSGKNGFIIEMHLYSEGSSITIRRIDKGWYLDKVFVSNEDTKIFFAQYGKKVKMAQIWEEKEDEFCEGMDVLSLEKVVFAGFEE